MILFWRYIKVSNSTPSRLDNLCTLLLYFTGCAQIAFERVCKTQEEEEEEDNTITFRLKCIVIA